MPAFLKSNHPPRILEVKYLQDTPLLNKLGSSSTEPQWERVHSVTCGRLWWFLQGPLDKQFLQAFHDFTMPAMDLRTLKGWRVESLCSIHLNTTCQPSTLRCLLWSCREVWAPKDTHSPGPRTRAFDFTMPQTICFSSAEQRLQKDATNKNYNKTEPAH